MIKRRKIKPFGNGVISEGRALRDHRVLIRASQSSALRLWVGRDEGARRDDGEKHSTLNIERRPKAKSLIFRRFNGFYRPMLFPSRHRFGWLGFCRTSVAAEAHTVKGVGHGNDFLECAFAHEADLYPVFTAQIAAVEAQEISRFLHGFANFHRVHVLWQGNRDNGRRCFMAVTDEVETGFSQP